MASKDKECVKYGLSMLGVFNIHGNEELKENVRTVGLCDEFTIFAISVMYKWPDGNEEIWKLARKVHGWGRIHACRNLNPLTEEIKRWFLLDGVHNNIMLSYSALVCWEKTDVENALKSNISKAEFDGIRDIIRGLLDEGPVFGMSVIEDRDEHVLRFLRHAGTFACEEEDYETIREIQNYFEDENAEITALCKLILQTQR